MLEFSSVEYTTDTKSSRLTGDTPKEYDVDACQAPKQGQGSRPVGPAREPELTDRVTRTGRQSCLCAETLDVATRRPLGGTQGGATWLRRGPENGRALCCEPTRQEAALPPGNCCTSATEERMKTRTRNIAVVVGLTHTEGNTRPSVLARMERSAAVLRPWHAGREASKNLGDPSSSCTREATVYGIQLLRHGRGNPETEQCWNLRAATHHVLGRRRSTGNGSARHMRLGSRIERSTLRWGKPTTWERSRRKHAARAGHSSRTCRTGSYESTSLRAIVNRVLPCAEASATEEPDAGKLHVRVCTGGAG